MADALKIEHRMLAIDEKEVVASGLGDARDVAGAPQPHRHAERDPAGLHALLDRVRELVRVRHGATPILSCLEPGLFRSQATWPSGWPPASASNNCTAVSIELRAWVSMVPPAACGVATEGRT